MTSSTAIVGLTCEYQDNPLGIDVAQPRLSWMLQSDARGVRQTAYRIVAAATAEDLNNPAAHLWDSGRIESDQSVLVAYDGPSLASRQRVYWQVAVWDNRDNHVVSSPAWWEMGLLERDDWQGEWIGGPWMGGPRTTSPAHYLRHAFAVDDDIVAARLYVTAIGVYECYLNGMRVGDDVLTPGWTDYHKRIQYQVYDVAALLTGGQNAIASIVGDGWAVGNIAWVGRQRYVDRPQFLAQLEITLGDGRHLVVATDETWSVSTGPILESDFLMGESYDARRELTGWESPNYDDSGWSRADVLPDSGAALVATNGPTVRRQETLRPKSIRLRPDFAAPRWVVDFGQNMVGWVRLKVSGPAGTTISIRHAEVLNADGTPYTANLRTATNTDYYTLKGDGVETFEPRFTFHGFRYVELGGFPGEPTADTIEGIVIHSDIPVTGRFECSDPLINQLQKNIVWSQKGNFVDVPTDCPQRDERLGWTGDAQVFVRTAGFNMNVAGFFAKWMQDLEDAQNPDGAYPAIAPNPTVWPIAEGGPAWADAGVIVPWTIYETYGDRRILEKHYGSMCRYIDFLDRTSRNGIRCYPDYEGWLGFGDWLALDGSDGREGGTSKELIGTAFFAYSTSLMARIAAVVGKSEDARRFEALFHHARAAFQYAYVNPDGTIVGGTQTSYVLALYFDLLPEDLRPAAAAELARLIQANDDHLSTGFVGTPYISHVLSETGHLDTAYDLLKQSTWPSWLYSVLQDATTIWERWDGWTHDKGFQDAGMNSFNHYAYGAIGSWLYGVVGGLEVDPVRPGYQHMILRPRIGGGLSSANIEYNSQYGMIRSKWCLDDGQFDWQISIPVNAMATVVVPVHGDARVSEGERPAEDASGVTLLERTEHTAVYEVGSGDYHFSTR